MYNPYQVSLTKILRIEKEGSYSKLFTLKRPKDFIFQSGQFVQVSLGGYGEAPISICPDPLEKKFFQICVRKVGRLTEALHQLKVGEKIGIRGPYGKGFPENLGEKRNLLLIAGGLGLEPLRPLIWQIIRQRNKFQKVQLFYGAKTREDLLFKREYKIWTQKEINLNICLERPEEGFRLPCPVIQGVVTILFEKSTLLESPIAFLCGPPIMYRFVFQKLKKAGFKDEDIYLSFERRMHCGIGICQHCAINSKYVCKDGPVFSWKELKDKKVMYEII